MQGDAGRGSGESGCCTSHWRNTAETYTGRSSAFTQPRAKPLFLKRGTRREPPGPQPWPRSLGCSPRAPRTWAPRTPAVRQRPERAPTRNCWASPIYTHITPPCPGSVMLTLSEEGRAGVLLFGFFPVYLLTREEVWDVRDENATTNWGFSIQGHFEPFFWLRKEVGEKRIKKCELGWVIFTMNCLQLSESDLHSSLQLNFLSELITHWTNILH